MDHWTHCEVLTMLEGGNKQLGDFFDRHQLFASRSINESRYRTNASKFYKDNLRLHILKVKKRGIYRGRNSNRRNISRDINSSGKKDETQ